MILTSLSSLHIWSRYLSQLKHHLYRSKNLFSGTLLLAVTQPRRRIIENGIEGFVGKNKNSYHFQYKSHEFLGALFMAYCTYFDRPFLCFFLVCMTMNVFSECGG